LGGFGFASRTTRRVAKTATNFAGKLTEGRASFGSNEINSKIANRLNSEHLVTHVHGRPLLIPSAMDQMVLQQAGDIHALESESCAEIKMMIEVQDNLA
jgi:hypothetical protein